MSKPFFIQASIFVETEGEPQELIEPEELGEFDSQEEATAWLNAVIETSRQHGFLRKK